jgi:hypothetical protein
MIIKMNYMLKYHRQDTKKVDFINSLHYLTLFQQNFYELGITLSLIYKCYFERFLISLRIHR